ncbi:L-xylulose reductase [Vulpes lagopus]
MELGLAGRRALVPGGGRRHRAQHGPGAARRGGAGGGGEPEPGRPGQVWTHPSECPGVEPECVDLADWEATERALGSVAPWTCW